MRFILITLTGAVLVTGCGTRSITSLSNEIREIGPGILEGYIAMEEPPNSLFLAPPPPRQGSTAFQLDQEIAMEYLASDDEERRQQAARDAVLAFPEAVQAFNIVLDIPISKATTPHLYMILRRILAEVFPEQVNVIIKRGEAFGISQSVCNVNWYSDVVAGRMMGAAVVAKLHASTDFMIDLEAAKIQKG
jgi:hypothetical protein